MARKPTKRLLCDYVVHYLAKQYTTDNIGANSWTGTPQSQRYVVGRSISYGEDKYKYKYNTTFL